MGLLGTVTSTIFASVLTRLGIRNPDAQWKLSDTVIPVSIVDSDISLSVSSPIRGVPFSAGLLVAPAVNSILADTGALPAGNYEILIVFENTETANVGIAFQRRNAANAANIWQHIVLCSIVATANRNTFVLRERFNLEVNERIRVTNTAAGTAGQGYIANIWVTAA